jgi:deoxyribonuclease-4
MSIAGGLWRALERGQALGCGAVQIFLKNQRQWASPVLAGADVGAFASARRRTRLRHVFAHASYLVNLAAPGAEEWARAVDAFTDEVERGEALDLACVVIHPGSHVGSGEAAGLSRIVAALDEVTRRTPGYRVRIALENTAGGGGSLGRTFDQLGTMITRVARPERLGVCLDTCHLFVAGYDIRTAAGWRAVVDECAATVGLDRLLAIHLNDAQAGLGSRLDRHQHIGQGALGLGAFRRLLNDARFARIPKVLETPKEPEPQADLRNLARLRALRASATSSRRRAGTGPARGRSSSVGRAAHTRSGRS